MLTAIAAFFQRAPAANDETPEPSSEESARGTTPSHLGDDEDDYEIVDPDGDDSDSDSDTSAESPRGGQPSESGRAAAPQDKSRTNAGQALPNNPPLRDSPGRVTDDDLPGLVPLTDIEPRVRNSHGPTYNTNMLRYTGSKRRSETNVNSPRLCGPPPPKPLDPYLDMEERMFRNPKYSRDHPASRQAERSSYFNYQPSKKTQGRYAPKGEPEGPEAAAVTLRRELDADSNLKNPAPTQQLRTDSIITQAPARPSSPPRQPSLPKLSPSKAQQIAEERSKGTEPRQMSVHYSPCDHPGQFDYIRTWEPKYSHPIPEYRDRSRAGRCELSCSSGASTCQY